jgi:hypothetical protein
LTVGTAVAGSVTTGVRVGVWVGRVFVDTAVAVDGGCPGPMGEVHEINNMDAKTETARSVINLFILNLPKNFNLHHYDTSGPYFAATILKRDFFMEAASQILF